MSLCHCSAASDEASKPGGLWRSTHAAASVPSGLASSGGVAAVATERWHCVGATTAAASTVMTWQLARRDHPTLEHELVSPSASCPWREG
jgi:hypothetical protein